MAVFEALDAVDHRVVAALTLDSSGYRVECSCGWSSPVVDEPLRMFDEWAEHVRSSAGG